MNKEDLYNTWEAEPNGDPIEGTDKIYSGISKRAVIKHIAYERGVKIDEGDQSVKLENGNRIFAIKI